MRIVNTLHFRIPALVLLVGLVLIALGYARNVRWRVDRRLHYLREDAHAEGTRLSGMAQHLFRKNLPLTADLVLSYASVAPELELGLICDDQDTVRHATRLQWKGLTLDETPVRDVRPWLADVRKTMSGRVEEDLTRGRFVSVYPFSLGAEGSGGVVVLSYDLTGPLAEAKRFALHETVPQGMALLAGCALIWGVMHWLVTRRVDDLLGYTHSVEAGEVPAPPHFGNDELGTVGRGMRDAVEKMVRTESRLLEASELDRLRIGRDLHDDVCQRITAAQLRIGVMGSALADAGSSLATTAKVIEAELGTAAEIARGFARGLAPVALDVQGLDTAFMDLGRFLGRAFGIRCEVICDEGTESLDSETKAHIYRIAQELATNAAKHAKGTFVSIRLTCDETKIRLEVENDGNDFAQIGGGGLGLQFVQQRVRALGGRIQSVRRPGGRPGSLIICEAPAHDKPAATHPEPSTQHP